MTIISIRSGNYWQWISCFIEVIVNKVI